jgi:hypothetical protein
MDLTRDAEKTYPGSVGQKSTRSQILIRNNGTYLAWVWNKISTKKIANELVSCPV